MIRSTSVAQYIANARKHGSIHTDHVLTACFYNKMQRKTAAQAEAREHPVERVTQYSDGSIGVKRLGRAECLRREA